MPGGFHVRLVAGKETRIKRMMGAQHCERDAAEQMIEKTDLARRRFVKTYFGGDIDDPHTYDLIVNTDRLSPAAAARIVMAGMKQKLGRA